MATRRDREPLTPLEHAKHKAIGALVRDLRKARGHSQGSYAALLGWSKSRVTHIETGRAKPNFVELDHMLAGIGVRLKEFVTLYERKKKELIEAHSTGSGKSNSAGSK